MTMKQDSKDQSKGAEAASEQIPSYEESLSNQAGTSSAAGPSAPPDAPHHPTRVVLIPTHGSTPVAAASIVYDAEDEERRSVSRARRRFLSAFFWGVVIWLAIGFVSGLITESAVQHGRQRNRHRHRHGEVPGWGDDWEAQLGGARFEVKAAAVAAAQS